MCLLFIPIVWFTFQCSFIHLAQFFQELYWVLTQVSHYTPRYVSLSRHPISKAILKYKNHPSIIIKIFCRVVQDTDSFARILKENADYFAEYICLQMKQSQLEVSKYDFFWSKFSCSRTEYGKLQTKKVGIWTVFMQWISSSKFLANF